MYDIEKMREQIKKNLDSYRYRHTMGVMYTAASLAMRYEIPLNQAMAAGLLHDCAKCIPNEEKIAMCSQYGIELTETELKNTALIHPKLGAYLAKTEYGVEDEDILNAIANHTTGRPNMSLLEKIIYIADYIEPGRKEIPDLSLVRKLAFEDIDVALSKTLEGVLQYLKKSNSIIDVMTEETHNFYKNFIHKETN